MKPRLHVLVCSTRPGRVGSSVGQWTAETATQHAAFDVRLVELADFRLPVYDEPAHPRLGKYEHEHTRAWAASVQAADAFVFVLPEYNFAPPGALVNAMNYLVNEWQYKPVAFVSYGGMSGGLRAVQVTKQLLTSLKVMPLVEAVAIPNVAAHLDAHKAFVSTDAHLTSAAAMFVELHRWSTAMAALRAR